MMPLSERHQALHDLRMHCESAYPYEACGVIAIDGDNRTQCIPGENLTPSASTFLLDPATLIACRRRGYQICALYHSHCDAPPILSTADQESALAAGSPAWPGVDLIVNTVSRGASTALAHYQWNSAAGRFVAYEESAQSEIK